MTDRAATVRTFLTAFFGLDNRFDLDKIERGEGQSGKVRPWILRLTAAEPLPTVLPRWTRDDEVIWYGLAHSDGQLRDLGERLMAFVGPTWSTFRGQRTRLDASDPVEAAVLHLTDGRAYRFGGNASQVWEALERMRCVWDRQPIWAVEAPVPTGRVLRNFDMALQVGNRESAEAALRYLTDHSRLDALNLLFLRVQLLSTLRCWQELLDLPQLAALLQIRKPPAVVNAVIRAVYHRELARFEQQRDVRGAVEAFRQWVVPTYGLLFTTVPAGLSPETIKSFMLAAVSADPPRPELRDELLKLTTLDAADSPYVNAIASLLVASPQKPTEPSLSLARDAALNGDFHWAFDLARDLPPSRESIKVLFECAYELQSLDAKRAALAAFEGLPVADQEIFYTGRRSTEILEYLTSSDDGGTSQLSAIPEDWITWFDRLEAESGWSRALEVARQGADEWDVAAFVASEQKLIAMEGRLRVFPAGAEEHIHNALPALLRFFQRDHGWPRRECQGVYFAFLDVLAHSTNGGDDDLRAFTEIATALFAVGVSQSNYLAVLGYAQEIWRSNASPYTVDWALDFLDILIVYPCPATDVRIDVLLAITNELPRFGRRLKRMQWQLLKTLAADLGQADSLRTLLDEYLETPALFDESGDALSRLAGCSVAIYTLTEAVAVRVKGMLEEVCQRNITVHLSHDLGGTDRLKQIARNDDVFVMATASAKHAATEFIEANRPKGLPILRPAGKGSASMLAALRSYALSLPA